MKINLLLYYLILISYFIGGVIAIILSFFHHWNREHIGLIFFMGAILASLISKHLSEFNYILKTEDRKNNLRFHKIIFIIFLCISLIPIFIFVNSMYNYYLPIHYFFTISLIGVLISMQILIPKNISKSEEYLILSEILILSTVISTSFLFLFPGPYGNDSSYHVKFIKSIIASGNINSYPGQYQNYPIYHLLFVFINLISGIDNFKFIQLILAIIQIIFLIFLFMLVRKLFNKKIALLSILFSSLSPYLLQPRYVYYPNSFTTIFFIFILYLFFYPNTRTVFLSCLFIITFIISVFSHPLTPAILIATFLLIFIISVFFKLKEIKLGITTVLFMLIFTLTWWMKPIGIQQDLFSSLILSIKNALETLDNIQVTKATLSPLYSWIDVVLYELGFTFLTFLGIIGAFCSLKKISSESMKELIQNNEKVFLLSIIILLLIPIPYLLAIIYPQSLPERWFPFIEVIVNIFAGFSIITIFQILSKYKLSYLVFLIPFTLIFFMTTSPIVNPNSKIYSQKLSSRSALTEPEIKAGDFINSLQLQHIHANSKYIAFVNGNLSNPSDFINPNDPSTYNSGLVVVRNYDLEKGFVIPLFGAKGKLLDIIYPNEQFYCFLNNSNKLYDNGEVRIHLTRDRRG